MKKSGPLFSWLAGLVLTAAIVLSACSSPFDRDRLDMRRVVIEMNTFLGMQPANESGGRFLAPDIRRVTLTLTPKGSGAVRTESGSLSYDSASDSLSGRIVIDAIHPGQYSLRAEALDDRGTCLALCISEIEIAATGQQQISILLTPPDEELFYIPAGYEYSGGAPGGSETITLAPGRRLVIHSRQQSLANQSLFGISSEGSLQELQLQLRGSSGELVHNPQVTGLGNTRLIRTDPGSGESSWYLLLYNSHSSDSIVLEGIQAAPNRPLGAWFSSVQAVPVDNNLLITADYTGPGSPRFRLSWQNVYGETELSDLVAEPEFSIPDAGEDTLWQIQAVIGSGSSQVYHLSQEYSGFTEPGDSLPKIMYVDSAAPTGGDGSESSPFNSIAAAYAAAAPAGDVIKLAAGEYYIGSEGQPLLLEKSVHIRGEAMTPSIIKTLAVPGFSDTIIVSPGVTVRLESLELHVSSFDGERSAVRVLDGGELDAQNLVVKGSAGTGGSSSLIVLEGNSSLLLQGSELFPSVAAGVPEVYAIRACSTFTGNMQIGGSDPWQSNYFLPDAALEFQAQYVLRHIFLEGEDQGPGAAGTVTLDGNVFGDFIDDTSIGSQFRVYGAEMSGDWYEDLSAVVYAEQGSSADLRIRGNRFAGINMYVNGELDELLGVFNTIRIESAERIDISGNSFISEAFVRESLTSVLLGEIAEPALFSGNYMHLSGDSGSYGLAAFASRSNAHVFSNVIHAKPEINRFRGLEVAPGSIIYGNTIISDRTQEDGDSPPLIAVMDEGAFGTEGDVWIINNLLRTASADQRAIADWVMYAELDVHLLGNLMQKSSLTQINNKYYDNAAELNNDYDFASANRFIGSDADLQLAAERLMPVTSGAQQVSNLIRFGGVNAQNVLPSGLLSSLPAEVQSALNADFTGQDRSNSHSIGAYAIDDESYVDLDSGASGALARLYFENDGMDELTVRDSFHGDDTGLLIVQDYFSADRPSPITDEYALNIAYASASLDYTAVAGGYYADAFSDFTTSQTWSFWLERFPDNSLYDYDGPADIIWVGQSDEDFAWKLELYNDPLDGWVFRLQHGSGGMSGIVPIDDLSEMWNHFRLEWNAEEHMLYWYINNEEVNTLYGFSLYPGDPNWTTVSLGVGPVEVSEEGPLLADIRAYNRLLTENEITALSDGRRPVPDFDFELAVQDRHEDGIPVNMLDFFNGYAIVVEFNYYYLTDEHWNSQIEIYFGEQGQDMVLLSIGTFYTYGTFVNLSNVNAEWNELLDFDTGAAYQWKIVLKFPGGSVEGPVMQFSTEYSDPMGT